MKNVPGQTGLRDILHVVKCEEKGKIKFGKAGF